MYCIGPDPLRASVKVWLRETRARLGQRAIMRCIFLVNIMGVPDRSCVGWEQSSNRFSYIYTGTKTTVNVINRRTARTLLQALGLITNSRRACAA